VNHHVIISGTGRAGTTFLVQLMTALGLDTGFTDPEEGVFPNCQGGMEHDLRRDGAPYIVKSPALCQYLDGVLERKEAIIDHAIIPVRGLYAAAESRRDVTRRTDPDEFPGGVVGGLWNTEQPDDQERVLAEMLYALIYTLARHDVPHALLFFPRFIHDPAYLYSKLTFLLNGITYSRFLMAYRQTVNPELVHEFDWRKEDISNFEFRISD